jgi:hypothetical protein
MNSIPELICLTIVAIGLRRLDVSLCRATMTLTLARQATGLQLLSLALSSAVCFTWYQLI